MMIGLSQFEKDALVICVTLLIIGMVCYLDYVVTKKNRKSKR
jgi:hypothetical protein